MKAIDLKKNKNKNYINNKSYINNETTNYFSEYNTNNNINNANFSEKYNLLNIRKNYSNLNSNEYRNIIIPHNFKVNNINSRNKVNKYFLMKKDGILGINNKTKFIINNTFINNYNNSNIINIKNNKSRMKKDNLNLCVSLRNEKIERKKIIIDNIKDTYFNINLHK